MKIQNIDINKIKPYWRNPRVHNNTEELKESILRYGFSVPLILDRDNVIIAGHGRYKASISLGLTEVPCIVREDLTPQQAKELRLVDNKISELSHIDQDKALQEMREIKDLTDFLYFFPEYVIDDILQNSKEQVQAITQSDIEASQHKIDNTFGDRSDQYIDAVKQVTCPHCLKSFGVDKTQFN
jgi:hypothetical protein